MLWALYDENREPSATLLGKRLGLTIGHPTIRDSANPFIPLGYSDSVIRRVLERLEVQGYLITAGQGSKVVRVEGEDRKKSRIKDYGNPLTYIGQYVSHWKTK